MLTKKIDFTCTEENDEEKSQKILDMCLVFRGLSKKIDFFAGFVQTSDYVTRHHIKNFPLSSNFDRSVSGQHFQNYFTWMSIFSPKNKICQKFPLLGL